MMNKKYQTSNPINCLAYLSNDRVFTPESVVIQLLDLLSDDVWKNPYNKFLNPCTKSGNILKHIYNKLFHGLKDVGFLKDDKIRKKYILDNMIYGIALDNITAITSRVTLYGDKNIIGNIWYQPCEHNYNKGNKCIDCGASNDCPAYPFIHKPIKEIFDMKFDVIVGNPPYQRNTSSNAPAIYHHFVNKSKQITDKIVMIVPARWFSGGMGLSAFRKKMLNDCKTRTIVYFTNAEKVFEGVEIKGGICYFFWDNKYEGDCTIIPEGDYSISTKRPLNEFEILIRCSESIPIVKKVLNKHNNNFLNNKIKPINIFEIPTNCSEKFNFDFNNKKINIHYNIKNNSYKGWIDRHVILPNKPQLHNIIDKWKVLMTKSGDGKADRNNMRFVTGKPFVSPPPSCCSMTYIVAGVFDTEIEAKNYETYLKTKFVRFLVGLYANTQNINRNQFAFVPDLPMDRKWTDADLYDLADLTKKEIAFIESQIKEMP